MSTAEMREFTRRMDSFILADRLAAIERVALGILAHPQDDRREEAQEILDLIACIRRHRKLRLDTSLMVFNLQRLVRRSNAKVVGPFVKVGNRVLGGSKKGAKVRLGSLDKDANKQRVAAFREAMKTRKSVEAALTCAAAKLGVHERTIRRACKAEGISLLVIKKGKRIF
jgi:hypothetical protein